MLQLDIVLIAFRRKAQTAIKKSVEKAQPFISPQISTGPGLKPCRCRNSQRYSLVTAIAGRSRKARPPGGSATLTALKITLLDVVPRLGEQPVAQVPEDFFDSSPQFLERDSPHISGERGGSEFRDQLDRRFVGMTLNHPNQA
jgi:hypothetical protein